MTVRSVRRAVSIFPVALAILAAGVSTASAQSLRPNILFIFDTSGSMNDNGAGSATIGEDTNICVTANTSKIFGLKSALRAALAQSGTDEANFGLMSFSQVVVANPNTARWCLNSAGGQLSAGHYNAAAGRTPVPNTPNRPGSAAYPSGCLMTSDPNSGTFGPWFGTGASDVFRVGVTTAAPGVTPVAANYDPPDANIAAIYNWIDNVELPTTSAAVTDPELHATGSTPLGRSLFYSRMYYDGLVKPNDPKSTCRQNVVIMMTDGAETCDPTTAPDNTFTATCTGGGNYDPFHPVAQACQLLHTSNIKTYFIVDSAIPAADMTAANRMAAAGGTGAAIPVSLADANAAKTAIVGIIASTVPPAEVCNGRDDNCNGQIDEGVSNNCRANQANPNDPNDPDNLRGAAALHCAVEVDNCMDDNCNGQVDEGFPQNACGTGGVTCPVPKEICDGKDNNCNGQIDEGLLGPDGMVHPVGGPCDNGVAAGVCRRIGVWSCASDGTIKCDLGNAPIKPDICNGIDDDCDGIIDNGLGMDPRIGVDCGIQGQGCDKGVTECINGKPVCSSVSNPQPEICDGKDNDCNGIIDDGVFPGVGDACICAGLDPATVGVGLCKGGHLACKGVEGVKCDGCVFPQAEICDGKDNDCDGMIDTMATCPTGFGCRDGSCGLLCKAGEFPCPPGYDCTQSYCVPNRCKNVQCPRDQKCDNDSGSCVELCYKVSCMGGQTCMHGTCYDCSNNSLLACAAGQACINRQCVVDKCAAQHCNSNEYCSDGQCVALTCVGCGPQEKCIAGQCTPDNCAMVTCAPTVDYCEPASGACKPSLCAAKTCPFCAPATGQCTPDPCANIGCPSDGCWSCQVTPMGQPYCQLSDSCGYVQTVAGNSGGGCACGIGDDGQPLSAAFAALTLLGLTIFTKRRRRRCRRS